MSTIPTETFNNLYEEQRGKLYKFSLSITRNIHKTEEVVQEVFTRLYKQDWDNISGHVNQWIFTVCRNLSLRYIQHDNKFLPLFDEDRNEMTEEASPDENLSLKEYKSILKKLINQLSMRQKEVIKYHFLKDMSTQEIVKKMNTSDRNIYFLKCVALAELRKKFETYHADEERLRVSVKKAPKSRSKKSKLRKV